MSDVFDALGEKKRRQILQVLSAGEQTAGTIVDALQAHGTISQPAVSQHLRVLREAGLVTMHADGSRRVYAIDLTGVDAAHAWLTDIGDPLGPFAQPLDALATEVARGRRDRRTTPPDTGDAGTRRRRRSA